MKRLYGDNVTALKKIFSSEQSLYDFVYQRGGYVKPTRNIIKKQTLPNKNTAVGSNLLDKLLDLAIKTHDNELAKIVLKKYEIKQEMQKLKVI